MLNSIDKSFEGQKLMSNREGNDLSRPWKYFVSCQEPKMNVSFPPPAPSSGWNRRQNRWNNLYDVFEIKIKILWYLEIDQSRRKIRSLLNMWSAVVILWHMHPSHSRIANSCAGASIMAINLLKLAWYSQLLQTRGVYSPVQYISSNLLNILVCCKLNHTVIYHGSHAHQGFLTCQCQDHRRRNATQICKVN